MKFFASFFVLKKKKKSHMELDDLVKAHYGLFQGLINDRNRLLFRTPNFVKTINHVKNMFFFCECHMIDEPIFTPTLSQPSTMGVRLT